MLRLTGEGVKKGPEPQEGKEPQVAALEGGRGKPFQGKKGSLGSLHSSPQRPYREPKEALAARGGHERRPLRAEWGWGWESGPSGSVGTGCPHSHSSERLNHFDRETLRRVKVMNECRQGSGGGQGKLLVLMKAWAGVTWGPKCVCVGEGRDRKGTL